MKYIKNTTILSIVLVSLASCTNSSKTADGYGNFEATEITISAENNGKLIQFAIEEGDVLKEKTFIGYIDTIPISLKREQLEVSKVIIASKSKSVLSQISVLDAKLKTLNFLISRPDTSREEFKEVINQTGIVLDDLKSLINRNLDPLRNG
mgnify:CR=1 FL=1